MDEFLLGLYKFNLTPEGLRGFEAAAKWKVLIFITSCAMMGALTVILDFTYYLVKKKSLFKFSYDRKSFWLILFGWTIGAAITGFFGQVANIFQISVLAAATAGVAWPILATKLIRDWEQASAKMAVDPASKAADS